MNKTRKVFHRAGIFKDSLFQLFKKPYFGFVQGHDYISQQSIDNIKALVGSSEVATVNSFEREFAALVGQGQAVSFASGRMGFYVLMKILDIGPGNEVILLGSTCSVMVNAVIRIGAIPVFSDIDQDTFGSSSEHIMKCITPLTRMIVAQHSFGIPCEIIPIVDIARSHNIFLLEDCAISLGSGINGVSVGNFGDAAIFSTDHSKPINTLTGGLVYTCNHVLFKKLLTFQENVFELPLEKQRALWKRFKIERSYCNPVKYGRLFFIDLIMSVKKKLLNVTQPFLDLDFQSSTSKGYPYPAKLPAFLALIGLHEIKRWPLVREERKSILTMLLNVAQNSEVEQFLPNAYFNKQLSIVPLRFVWTQQDGAIMRERLSDFVHIAWTWFMKPIIATAEPLERFGYIKGTCPISEQVGVGMVNLPCNLSLSDAKNLVKLFQKTII